MLSEKTSRRPVALDERPAHTALRSPSRPTASIARSISWGFTWRKLVHWLLEDVLVVSLLICAFVWHCTAMLPAAAADGITENVLGTPIVEPSHCVFTGNGTNISTWKFTIHGGDGAEYATMMEPYVRLLIPPAAFMLFCQVLDLFDFFSDTRRVRRKLQPLNDLAIAAEAIGQVTASRDPMTDDDKMATLEQAIERATVDSPTVSTGDKDLRSIEVALNGLLRQMQEAKLQQMRFVSDASHELRTPIAVIQGYVNMLDRWGKTDESVLEESIEALKAESDHMQELVEQLLFLARGDSGRNALNRTDVNIAQVVHEVWEESCMIDEQHDYRCTVSEDDTQSDRLLTEALPCSSRACASSCRTRRNTPPPARPSPSPHGVRGKASATACRTRASACRRPTCATSSSASTAPRARETERLPEPDWGSPSPSGSWTRTRDRSRWSRARAWARASSCGSPPSRSRTAGYATAPVSSLPYIRMLTANSPPSGLRSNEPR